MIHQSINRCVLNNGIKLITIENQAADVIAGRIFLKKAGALWETREKAGLSHLLSAVITKGTEKLSAVEIAEKIEFIGANLGTEAASDYFVMGIKTVTKDFFTMLHLAGEILRSPSFPEEEVKLEKKLTLQNIRSQLEQPFNVAYNQLREVMYPNHPYGVSILGTQETVENLTREDLQQYHQTFFRPDNITISLSGNLTHQQGLDWVNNIFGKWENPNIALSPLILTPIKSQPTTKFIPQDSQQTIIMLGYLVKGVLNDDYPILKLINTYLGNGLSSRLFVELREKRGLAYDVSAFYPTRIDSSQFVVYIGTAPHNGKIAQEGLKAEVDRVCESPLSKTEIQAAKNKLLGQYALGKQTNSELAQIYGWYENLGLGLEFDDQFQEKIKQITPEMIHQTAQNNLQEPYISIVGSND
jgi:zinc protease